MNNKWFTLVELIIVITILAILVTMSVALFERNDIDEECAKYNSKKILEDIDLCDKLYLWNCRMKAIQNAWCLQKLD